MVDLCIGETIKVGGDNIPWTGGSMEAATKHSHSASTKAWRLGDLKRVAKVEEQCSVGLKETYHLSTR